MYSTARKLCFRQLETIYLENYLLSLSECCVIPFYFMEVQPIQKPILCHFIPTHSILHLSLPCIRVVSIIRVWSIGSSRGLCGVHFKCGKSSVFGAQLLVWLYSFVYLFLCEVRTNSNLLLNHFFITTDNPTMKVSHCIIIESICIIGNIIYILTSKLHIV